MVVMHNIMHNNKNALPPFAQALNGEHPARKGIDCRRVS